MLTHIKESTYFTFGLVGRALMYVVITFVGALVWSNGFKNIGWVYKEILPRAVIFLVAYYLTPLPFIAACFIVLLPVPAAAGITIAIFFYSLVRF